MLTQEEVYAEIIEKLKAMVAEHGSQEVVGDCIGFTGAYVSSIINGSRKPSKNVIDRFGYEVRYVRKSS